jgi:squalene-hopene/tetraprenyl-beta-curcumene cyclase
MQALRLISVGLLVSCVTIWAQQPARWDPRAAATYLDTRMDWWLHWPSAARDHETSCVSCHTALPYALARPALHAVLEEKVPSAPERMMLANVVKRVQLWKEVEPFYPDQTRGLPKTSESRGTESVLNALVLATRDSYKETLSEEARTAFNNMWALQFRAGDLKGAWAWLNFHLEPWESPDSPYFGATLAAIAIGRAPEHYSSSPEIQESLKLLREFLQQRADSERLFNRVMALWASTKLSGVLTASQTKAIIDDVVRKQRNDGGWATSDLGTWKRVDSSELDTASDGYATGLITVALKSAGVAVSEPHVVKAVEWLSHHQDPETGMWSTSSLNKQRDPSTDAGKFMSDAATAYAVLALTGF